MTTPSLRRGLGLLVALATLAAPLAAQDLEARLRRLTELVAHGQQDAEVPGVALGVLVDGEVVLSRGFGVADLASGAPVGPDTVFAIGSVTKSFTAVLTGRAVDEGLVALDEPLSRHVPARCWPVRSSPACRSACPTPPAWRA